MHKQYALIGKRLEHSFSKDYFTRKFEKKQIEASYTNIELDNVSKIRSLSQFENISGFNITIPFKEKIIAHLDNLSEDAAAIQAVNCVQIVDSKWMGHNTDVIGFKKSLSQFLGNQKPKALIFGTGGASKAVQFVCQQMKIKFQLVSRNDYLGTINYSDLDEEIISEFKLLINTTPVGMYPNVDNCLKIPYEFVSKKHCVYDLVYNPAKTQFLERCQDRGAKILNGIEMLEIQAEESWEIWNS